MKIGTRGWERNLGSALALALFLLVTGAARAQTPIGPFSAQPPSYGTPTDPNLAGFGTRLFSAWNIRVNVIVPFAQVQALLPANYVPLQYQGDPTRTTIQLSFASQDSVVLTKPVPGFAAGTYGPYDTANVAVVTLNQQTQSIEVLGLESLVNNSELVDLFAAAYGPGSTRLGDFSSLSSHNAAGQLVLSMRARDAAGGLRMGAQVQLADLITSQLRNSLAVPIRFLNANVVPETTDSLGWLESQTDESVVTGSAVTLAEHTLSLPGGQVSILGLLPTEYVDWSSETFVKFP